MVIVIHSTVPVVIVIHAGIHQVMGHGHRSISLSQIGSVEPVFAERVSDSDRDAIQTDAIIQTAIPTWKVQVPVPGIHTSSSPSASEAT